LTEYLTGVGKIFKVADSRILNGGKQNIELENRI
jgi:hypothetical protein